MLHFLSFHIAKKLNLRNIVNVFRDANISDGDWQNLAEQLILPSETKTIQSNYPHDARRCMSEAINTWLNQDTEASWHKLADAVERECGKVTADAVRKKSWNVKVSNVCCEVLDCICSTLSFVLLLWSVYKATVLLTWSVLLSISCNVWYIIHCHFKPFQNKEITIFDSLVPRLFV